MVEAVIQRLLRVLGIGSETQLAKELDLKRGTIASWKTRKSIPFQLIYQLALEKKFSLDYVLLGEGDPNMQLQDNHVQDEKYQIVDDFIMFFGSHNQAQEYLALKLTELVVQKFQNQNNNIHTAIQQLLEFFPKSAKDGLFARPLLFLYYVLHNVQKSAKQSPKEVFIQAIENTHFSRWTFGPEFSKKRVKEIQDHINFIMDEKEVEILISNPTITIQALESQMPPAMLHAHKKNINKNIKN